MGAHFTILHLIFHHKFSLTIHCLQNPQKNRKPAAHWLRDKIYKLTRLKLIDSVNQSVLWKYSTQQFIMGDIQVHVFPLFPGDLFAKLQQKLFLHCYFVSLLFVKRLDRDSDFMSNCLQTPNTTVCSPLVILCQTNPSAECFDVSFHATLWFSSCTLVHRGRLISSAYAQWRPASVLWQHFLASYIHEYNENDRRLFLFPLENLLDFV